MDGRKYKHSIRQVSLTPNADTLTAGRDCFRLTMTYISGCCRDVVVETPSIGVTSRRENEHAVGRTVLCCAVPGCAVL